MNYEQKLNDVVHDYKVVYGTITYHESDNKEKEFNKDGDFQY